jgi:hypothetical protein
MHKKEKVEQYSIVSTGDLVIWCLVHLFSKPIISYSTIVARSQQAFSSSKTKGVGPSTTLAWPGWKQPDIAVEVDKARLETSLLKML